jgi:hypothetical protein
MSTTSTRLATLDPEFLFAGHDFTKIREVMKGLDNTHQDARRGRRPPGDDQLHGQAYLKRLGSFR